MHVFTYISMCACLWVAGLTEIKMSVCICTDLNDSARQLSHESTTVAKTYTHTIAPYNVQHSLPLSALIPLSYLLRPVALP